MREGACPRCWGCGQLANTEAREPWSAWLSLPTASHLAMLSGIVAPISCDACAGTGSDRETLRAQEVERFLEPENVLCVTCMDRGWRHKTLYVNPNSADPQEVPSVIMCTSCMLLTPQDAVVRHAHICGCDLPWLDPDMEAGDE